MVIFSPTRSSTRIRCTPKGDTTGSDICPGSSSIEWRWTGTQITLTNNLADRSFFAYDQEGKRVAFVETNDNTNRLVVLSEGKVVFTRSLGEKADAPNFSSAALSPKGDTLWAAFQRNSPTNATVYGLMEIPLGDAPLREIKLLETEHASDDMMSLYFQVALSHDGKTAALASTYLAFDEEKFAAESCALFLVDLGSSERKVTKVPIPLPSRPLAK